MKNFLLTYWISMILLFIVFYWEVSPLSSVINLWQTDLTSFLTSMVLPSHMMENNHILISLKYNLVIEKACNGMMLYLFFLAPIIAFPATLQHKIGWAIGGYFIILGVNTFRIWFITQLVLDERSNFSLAHDYLGNILLIITSILLFMAFVKSRKKRLKQVAYA
jgi:exosortase/archaeosortase family protein